MQFIQAKILIFFFSLIGLLPYTVIFYLSRLLGLLVYHFYPPFRKRTLSNLALAKALSLTDTQRKSIAKKSLQNLMLTLLEYPYISMRKGKVSKIAHLENREILEEMKEKYKAVVFLSAHQGNWEVPFIELTTHTKSLAVGRPIKNPYLYKWITKLREIHGGKMVTKEEAIKEASFALKNNITVGIVGDQGLTDSSFNGPFLGRFAWTSPVVALLAYKFNKPLIVGINKRVGKKQIITYSEPIIPNQKEPLKKEVKRMMTKAMQVLEESIKKNPQDWLWQHNRWKQPTTIPVKKKLRYETILITLPEKKELCQKLLKKLTLFDKIYPHHFITLLVPKSLQQTKIPINADIQFYTDPKELFQKNPKFKLVFDFSGLKNLRAHYKKRVLQFVSLQDMGFDQPDFSNFEEKFTNFIHI